MFLGIIFLTGGASSIDVQSLMIVRPLSVAACAIALLTLRREHVAARLWLFAGFGSIMVLCFLHLIPLPSGAWQHLPGKELSVQVERVAGLGNHWRPLTFTPVKGLNALATLTTPLAVLLLGTQLGTEDLYRLRPLLLCFGIASALVGLLQILGGPSSALYVYRIHHQGSAVGLFANRNHAAVMLACMFPIMAVYVSMTDGKVVRQNLRQAATLSVGIVLVPLILLTGSRTGMALALLAMAAAAILHHKALAGKTNGSYVTQTGRPLIYVLLAAVLIGIVVLTIYFSRAEALERLVRQSVTEDGRAEFWQLGLQLTYTYVPFGSGIGAFVEPFQVEEQLGVLSPNYASHMHNDWLEIVQTGGLPAIMLLLAAVACYLRRTIKLWFKHDPDRDVVSVARLGSVLILMIALASVTDYPLRTPSFLAAFVIFCLWFAPPPHHKKADNLSKNEAR